MAAIFPTSGTTTLSLSADDTVFIARGVSITTTDTWAIRASSSLDDDIEIISYGRLAALGENATEFLGDGLQFTNFGDISSAGISASSPTGTSTVAVDIQGDAANFVNHGNVAAPTAVFLSTSSGTTISNFGTLATTELGGDAIFSFVSDDFVLNNHGSILGEVVRQSGNATIYNSGLIAVGEGDIALNLD